MLGVFTSLLPSRTVEFIDNIYISGDSGLLGCAAVSLDE